MADNDTNVSELKSIVRKFCEERDWDQFHTPTQLAIGMSTEANELLEIFRFKNDEQAKEMMSGKKKEEITDELSDVVFFALRFADMNGIDVSESLRRKISKNGEKYPVERSKGSNKKYNEF